MWDCCVFFQCYCLIFAPTVIFQRFPGKSVPNFCRCQCSERLLGEVHLNLNCQSPQLNGWLTWNVMRMCRVDFPVWRYWNRTYPTTSPGRKRTSVFTICMCSNCSIHIKGLNWSGITLCIKRLLECFHSKTLNETWNGATGFWHRYKVLIPAM